jgi:hypothetical protein
MAGRVGVGVGAGIREGAKLPPGADRAPVLMRRPPQRRFQIVIEGVTDGLVTLITNLSLSPGVLPSEANGILSSVRIGQVVMAPPDKVREILDAAERAEAEANRAAVVALRGEGTAGQESVKESGSAALGNSPPSAAVGEEEK